MTSAAAVHPTDSLETRLSHDRVPRPFLLQKGSQVVPGEFRKATKEPRYDAFMDAKATTLLLVMLFATAVSANGELGFAPKYERDYNIFNPANKYAPDNPLNPAKQFDPNNPFNPVNRFDPNNLDGGEVDFVRGLTYPSTSSKNK
jgi:hypothetical protein